MMSNRLDVVSSPGKIINTRCEVNLSGVFLPEVSKPADKRISAISAISAPKPADIKGGG